MAILIYFSLKNNMKEGGEVEDKPSGEQGTKASTSAC